MLKQAAALRNLQKQLAKMTVDFENAGVKVKVRCDMTLAEVTIAPSAIAGGDAERLGRQIVTAVNGALAAAQKKAAAEMSTLAGGAGGLAGLLGGR